MRNAKHHLDLSSNVLDEAKSRIHGLISEFDSTCVSFSGGKDSLVALHLLRECQLEAGHKGPTVCYFLDEELIPRRVVDFVRSYMLSSEWDLRWLAIPLKSNKFVLGQSERYIQWDESRRWVREKPEWATVTSTGGKIYDQYNAQRLAVGDLPGRTVALTGIRAAESLQRWSAIMSSRNRALPYLDADPREGSVWHAKPIYDWQEKDIFKYLYERKIRYCDVYDSQLWNGEEMRVSTPLHSERARKLDRLAASDPELWERVQDVFPDARLQARYWSEYDEHAAISGYPKSWAGIFRFIDEQYADPNQAKLARVRVLAAKADRERLLSRYPDAYGGFPLLYVFRLIATGNIKRRIQPLRLERVSQPMRDYENGV